MPKTASLPALFLDVRRRTETLCAPLQTEDYVLQPIVFVSPPKWHLGHTTWFFEEFILKKYKSDYKIFHEDFSFVFNSYYEKVGKRVPRNHRGNLSRPTVAEVYAYRSYVTGEMEKLLIAGIPPEAEDKVLLGIHHEKQHQELLLTDIKYIFGNNPLLPVYSDGFDENPVEAFEATWISVKEGIYEIGHKKDNGFCFDNELMRHKTYLQPFQISNKLITNGEYLEFMEAGGYKDSSHWHAEGWDWVQAENVASPLYWHRIDGQWQQYTLHGPQKIRPEAPLSHVSYYEAFAFAQWKDSRLPTEFEWEAAQAQFDWGRRWEWTESAYLPYPGYAKASGALGEYNGKFMVNQKVLRGGSVATPPEHTRPTYRNFFHPGLRWQYSGIRLAK